jgi:hypothetical protein
MISEVETARPNQLQITIHEATLEQQDSFQIHDDEFHIPTPNLPPQYRTTFQLDPSVYEFKQIFQFDDRKFLLVLWNKDKSRIEMFLDSAQRLAQCFKSQIKPFKVLNNTSKNILIAINEPKELIAIYDIEKVVVRLKRKNIFRSYH